MQIDMPILRRLLPRTNSLKQLMNFDRMQRQIQEEQDALLKRQVETIFVVINGVGVPIEIDVDSVRRAIELPEHDLLARGIFHSPPDDSQPPEDPELRDTQHEEPKGPHSREQGGPCAAPSAVGNTADSDDESDRD
jgi:hypothetical protein